MNELLEAASVTAEMAVHDAGLIYYVKALTGWSVVLTIGTIIVIYFLRAIVGDLADIRRLLEKREKERTETNNKGENQ